MRLIDRHELRKALEDNICADCEKDPNNLRCGACLMDVAIEYIIAAPAIEAVEAVRCKDCKHRHDDGYCDAWGDSFHHWEDFNKVPEDMFCGYGERREV